MKKQTYKYKVIGGKTKMPEKVVLGYYDRASTKAQKGNGAREGNKRVAVEFSEQENWELIKDGDAVCFTDIGISGADCVRPKLDELIKSGVNVIAVYDFDRFSRDSDVTFALNAKLQWAGITLIEVKEAEAFDSINDLYDGLMDDFKRFAIQYAISQGYTKTQNNP